MSFTDEIYQQIREGAKRSAEIIVPEFLKSFYKPPEKVLDVGCGEGWFGKAFEDAGCSVLGIDGTDAPIIPSMLCDLTDFDRWEQRADLVVCLEVAEHLLPCYADDFVRTLTRCSDVILFSAAIPGQGGVGHLNEQWPQYWVDLFNNWGYSCSGALRWRIWRNENVENWYRQNLMVCTNRPKSLPDLFDTVLAPMWPVVHPVLYDARRR